VGTRTKQHALAAVIFLTALASWVATRGGERDASGPPSDEATPSPADPGPHLLLGNPSNAAAVLADPNNYLLTGPAFAASYNRGKGGPNWVSWRLRWSDFGPQRRGGFHPDGTLPAALGRVLPGDYHGTGFDRGQLCPRVDRSAAQHMTDAAFAMSNVVPLSPHLTRGAWRSLEEYAGGLARRGAVVYVVAGVEGVGGEGDNGRADVIAGGKVTVPARCWKVLVVVEGGRGTPEDLDRVTAATRVIAVVMPNDRSVGRDWGRYRVSVREVESLTGYTFFARLSPVIAEQLKAKSDAIPVPLAAE
jgi:endonuclease G